MKIFLALLFGCGLMESSVDLEVIRKNYELAVADKDICRIMIVRLQEDTSSNIHLAYLGAYQTIWANHTANPFSKLKTFTTGKRNIDKAIALSPNDAEIVFVRYSVQQNCPRFLGYNSNIKQDRAFLFSHLNSISSAVLKKMVENILNI